MGLRQWLERKAELKKIENDAKAEAMKAYYTSEEYKKDIVNEYKKSKSEGGKDAGFSNWLKKVSNNAVNSLSNEGVKIDKEKLFGKK